MPFSQYLHEMSLDETYGDEFTFYSDIINIKLSIVCSLGWHAKQIISPASSVLIWKGNLGHFEEGQE